NLKNLSVGIKNNELETLKIIFNNCQYLESIHIWCGDFSISFLNERVALEMVAKYSPKNFCELKLLYQGYLRSRLSSEELESFFISWANRSPQKSLSLFATGFYYH